MRLTAAPVTAPALALCLILAEKNQVISTLGPPILGNLLYCFLRNYYENCIEFFCYTALKVL
jgi:hypothetical protein